MTTFSELNLAPGLLQVLKEEGYETPTPIQAAAIPPILAGSDLLGIAQTGTGKTAAFALPILHRLASARIKARPKSCRVLVLSPTRELATQIADSFRTYSRHVGASVTTVYGGVGYRPQIQALARGVDVLVATPGRLLDHLEQGYVALDSTEVFVLDEADQMLDLGFVKPIRTVAARLSSKRQSLFFSATMPPEIGKLAGELLRSPIKVSVAPASTTVERVTQRVIQIEHAKKRALLVELFADPEMSRALVFTRTKRGADRVAAHLETAGITVATIHGNKSQKQREEALASFRASDIRALVATDIAARGIDIDAVSHVVNYELPDVPESYVHRIGRTARAGAAGIAISLVDQEERGQLRDIETVTRQRIPMEDRRNDASLRGEAGTPSASRTREDGRGRAAPADRPRPARQRQDRNPAHASSTGNGGSERAHPSRQPASRATSPAETRPRTSSGDGPATRSFGGPKRSSRGRAGDRSATFNRTR